MKLRIYQLVNQPEPDQAQGDRETRLEFISNFKAPYLLIITKLADRVGSKYGFVAARTGNDAIRMGCRQETWLFASLYSSSYRNDTAARDSMMRFI